MNIIKNALLKIRNIIWGHPITNAENKLQRVVQQHARSEADVVYHTAMAKFYTEQLHGINPNEAWWQFARMKQSEADELNLVLNERRRRAKAEAVRKAFAERLEALQRSKPQSPLSTPSHPPAGRRSALWDIFA